MAIEARLVKNITVADLAVIYCNYVLQAIATNIRAGRTNVIRPCITAILAKHFCSTINIDIACFRGLCYTKRHPS